MRGGTMDTHENQCGLNADTPERALDDAER